MIGEVGGGGIFLNFKKWEEKWMLTLVLPVLKKREMLSEFDRPWQHFPPAHRLSRPLKTWSEADCAWKIIPSLGMRKDQSLRHIGYRKEVNVYSFVPSLSSARTVYPVLMVISELMEKKQ
jgi:hypothetical protein